MEGLREPDMPSGRLEALQEILKNNPSDSLARYGLAMELIKAGRFEEAVAEFQALIAVQPDHAYAYFHAGQTLEKLGRPGEARRMYQNGADAAARKGDAHARSELETALSLLPPESA